MLLLSCINASEFGIRRFPFAWKPNPAILCMAPETQSHKTQKVPVRSIANKAPVAILWMENLSAAIVPAAVHKLSFTSRKCQ